MVLEEDAALEVLVEGRAGMMKVVDVVDDETLLEMEREDGLLEKVMNEDWTEEVCVAEREVVMLDVERERAELMNREERESAGVTEDVDEIGVDDD